MSTSAIIFFVGLASAAAVVDGAAFLYAPAAAAVTRIRSRTRPVAGVSIESRLSAVDVAEFASEHQASSTPAITTSPVVSSISPHDAVQMQREDLKRRLLEAADNFKAIQTNINKAAMADKIEEGQDKIVRKNEGSYVLRLLRKIVAKVSGSRKKKNRQRKGKSKSILTSDSFRTVMLEVGEAGNATIALATELSKLNPTPRPTYGFKGYGGGSPSDCKLGGRWKLRFTTAADATFPESPKRGRVTTSQEINPDLGTLTNIVNFENGKLEGFRVVVAGDVTSDDEIDLIFRKAVILRRSRICPRLVFPIPRALIRLLSRRGATSAPARGPHFTLQYLDDDLRIHKTGDGNWFIQSRLE